MPPLGESRVDRLGQVGHSALDHSPGVPHGVQEDYGRAKGGPLLYVGHTHASGQFDLGLLLCVHGQCPVSVRMEFTGMWKGVFISVTGQSLRGCAFLATRTMASSFSATSGGMRSGVTK